MTLRLGTARRPFSRRALQLFDIAIDAYIYLSWHNYVHTYARLQPSLLRDILLRDMYTYDIELVRVLAHST